VVVGSILKMAQGCFIVASEVRRGKPVGDWKEEAIDSLVHRRIASL
jgi:hypothetical protein